ncbi:MAG TPA: DUF3037 domain-containing protein [Candidatus Polarisedimenticolia bacterium]|nr:DUF3037 domain-containing protein [Candidatus Polarisedimenticolia bacterium]
MTDRMQCRFFVLRYAPDAVKNEFINVGLVLLPPAGSAQVRFTRDWSRVLCLDPEADIEMLQALENDLRDQLREMNGDHDLILRRIQDSFSNAIQPSEFQACLAASAVSEADELARLYLERPKRRQQAREPGARVAVVARMRSEFEAAGVWPLMLKNIALSKYTRSGDPLKIDCGYSPNGTVKLFHAVALSSDVNAAKVLAFSFPHLAQGIRKAEGKQALLTAIVEDDLPVDDETVNFARETLEQNAIRIAPVSTMAAIAREAARELRIG